MRSWSIIIAATLTIPSTLLAQHDRESNPYTEWKNREIKALSPGAVAAYESGEGMGLALAAELNEYPGPRHVLGLADELDLTASQRARVTGIRDSMRMRAVTLGAGIVEREHELDSAFAGRTIDERNLEATLTEIARLQGELRFVHLRAHLAVAGLLSEEQRARYEALRGYASDHTGHR